jgi:hypothetical protein
MAKGSSGRRSGSATRSVYTGGKGHQLQKPIYGSTPDRTCSPNAPRVIGNTTMRQSHTIGAPRDDK